MKLRLTLVARPASARPWRLALGSLAVAAVLAAPVPAQAGAPVAGNAVWNGALPGTYGPPEALYPFGDVTATQAAFGVQAGDLDMNIGFFPSGLAVGSDGALYAWGSDECGELGDGRKTGLEELAPVEQVHLPGGAKPAQVSISQCDSVVLGTNGTIYTAGASGLGGLGDGSIGSRETFGAITLPQGVTGTAVSDGEGYMLAAGSDGRIYAWGQNGFGQLGNGTTTPTELPEPVSLPEGVSATAVLASEAAFDSFAIGSNGELYSWGRSENGSLLGDGESQASRSVPEPVELPAGEKVVSVAAAYEQAFAVTLPEASERMLTGAGVAGRGASTVTEALAVAVSGEPSPTVSVAVWTPAVVKACATLAPVAVAPSSKCQVYVSGPAPGLGSDPAPVKVTGAPVAAVLTEAVARAVPSG